MNQDEVSLAIQWDRIGSIAEEIFLSLIRTSFSTIVRESYDCCCTIFDARGRLIAQSNYGAPSFIGTIQLTLRHFLKLFPPESLKPGDVLITNDAWIGTGHIYDVSVLRPLFHNGNLVAFTGTVTHLPDIGGLGFAAVARDNFEEGLRIPPMKLAEEGRLNETLLNLVRNNVRVPDQTLGDIDANVAANETGARLLLELMDEHGMDSLEPLSDHINGRSETAMREAVQRIPDGGYQHEFLIEGFDDAIKIVCNLEVRDDEMFVDFDGTGPEVPAGINVPYCYTYAFSAFAVKCVTTPSLPNTGGSLRPLHVKAPPGCILNADRPAATGARHAVGHFVPFAIWGALAQEMPERLAAEMGMMNVLNFTGKDLQGGPFSTLCFSSGGFGGRARLDGINTTMGPTNIMATSVEAVESTTGVLVKRKELETDSGGPGRFRGGLGQHIDFQNRSDSPIVVSAFANRTSFPAVGYEGGGNGSIRQVLIEGEPIHPKGRHILYPGEKVLMPGQTLTVLDAGGGGFGPAEQRPVEAVARDVLEGYVSPEAALRDYGVAVDGGGPPRRASATR